MDERFSKPTKSLEDQGKSVYILLDNEDCNWVDRDHQLWLEIVMPPPENWVVECRQHNAMN